MVDVKELRKKSAEMYALNCGGAAHLLADAADEIERLRKPVADSDLAELLTDAAQIGERGWWGSANRIESLVREIRTRREKAATSANEIECLYNDGVALRKELATALAARPCPPHVVTAGPTEAERLVAYRCAAPSVIELRGGLIGSAWDDAALAQRIEEVAQATLAAEKTS